MINFKSKSQLLTIALFLLVFIGVTSVYTKIINAYGKNLLAYTSLNTTVKMDETIKKINIVVVRKNELLLVSLNNKIGNITLDSGGTFTRPLISPNNKYVSYLKDKVLYITTDKFSHIKVSGNVPQLSFAWQDKNSLLYSPASGGLYAYDVVTKISKPYLINEYNYQNITLGDKGVIYAEQYRNYRKNSLDYRDDYGILFFNPVTMDRKIVIKSIPTKIDTGGDLGMYPIITGISYDDKYLYVWRHPHAGSLAADGVDLVVYDILNNKLIEYTNPNIISLAYTDNISPNPKDSRYLALIYGGGREMGNNKNLVLLDILTGKFQPLTTKVEASMTPYYLSDGKTILYASSEKQNDVTGALTQWITSGNHHIFSVNTTTQKIKQITNNPNYFDFSPMYVSNKEMVFFRSDKNNNVSIWKYDNGQEIILADKLIFYDDMDYPIQSYYAHYNTTLFTDIK